MSNIPSVPKVLFMEMNNSCNLRCKMCAIEGMKRPVQYLDTSLCKKIIDNAATLKIPWLRLHFYGEPLLDKRLPEMITYAKGQGIPKVWITSNATMLSERLAEDLIESGLDDISLSVTGSSDEVYVRFQGHNSNYRLVDVEQAINKFINIRTKMKKRNPRITLQYIFDGNNFDDCISYINKWSSKVEKLSITNLNTVWGTIGDIVRTDKIPCGMLSEYMLVVLSNGEVTVCCSDLNGQMSLGNIKDHPIEYFWNSGKLYELRRQHATGDLKALPLCQKCDSIIEGMFYGDVLNDIYLRATAHSIMNLLKNQSKRLILFGVNNITKYMLLDKSLNHRTELVLDNVKTGTVRGKKIKKIDSLEAMDDGILIINSISASEEMYSQIVHSSFSDRFEVIRFDKELEKVKKTTG